MQGMFRSESQQPHAHATRACSVAASTLCRGLSCFRRGADDQPPCAGSGGADWKAYMKAHQRKVQKRVRKGIPDQLRGLVWQLLSGGRDLALRNEGGRNLERLRSV